MNPKLKELLEKLSAKQQKLASIFEEAKQDDGTYDFTKADMLEGDQKARVEKVQQLEQELEDLHDDIKELRGHEDSADLVKKLDDFMNAPEGTFEHPEPGTAKNKKQSFGKAFVDSDLYGDNGRVKKQTPTDIDIEAKTLLQTSAGWEPESLRSGEMLEYATRPIEVLDLIPTITIGQTAYKYMEETTFTNNAAEVAEAGTYGEAALAYTEKSQPVEKVGVWLPVTDEQLEDVDGMQALVDGRLRFMARQRLDSQVLNGDGVTPNLLGVNNASGILAQAKGTDPTPDAFYKAMTKIQTTAYAMPDMHIMHPNDWQQIRLLRTSDGIYIWGSPSEAGPERLWGLPVSKSNAQTEGTGLTGAFQAHSLLAVKRGIEVEVTNSHSDYFIKGKQAVRADMRAVVVWFRKPAFCQVTGI